MKIFSTKEIAEKWGISQRRVVLLAQEGRIPGARLFGNNWLFPSDAEKPLDGRTKASRASSQGGAFFRFPNYVDEKESAYFPPLSEEEKRLRQGQLAFHACRYEEAKKFLFPLAENAQNRYVRIAALFHCCDLAVYDSDVEEYDRFLLAFHMELAQDFPHQKEMQLLRYRMDANYLCYQNLWDGFRVEASYPYHPSAYEMMKNLSLLSLIRGDFALFSKMQFDVFETNCLQMEREGHFAEAQELHLLLVELYQIQANLEMALHHMRRAMGIAMERELYLRPAVHAFYYPEVTKNVLADFPEDFAAKMLALGREIHAMYVKFSASQQNSSFLSVLSDRDYLFISLAVQGRSNRETARQLKLSEKTVSKRYNDIYEKLNIKSKQELVELVNGRQGTMQAER